MLFDLLMMHMYLYNIPHTDNLSQVYLYMFQPDKVGIHHKMEIRFELTSPKTFGAHICLLHTFHSHLVKVHLPVIRCHPHIMYR